MQHNNFSKDLEQLAEHYSNMVSKDLKVEKKDEVAEDLQQLTEKYSQLDEEFTSQETKIEKPEKPSKIPNLEDFLPSPDDLSEEEIAEMIKRLKDILEYYQDELAYWTQTGPDDYRGPSDEWHDEIDRREQDRGKVGYLK